MTVDRPERSLRVLLDTNIWSYVADQGAVQSLRQVAKENDLDLLISPAVIFEQLRNTNEAVRKTHLDVTTRGCWTRMLPEAYHTCDELVEAIRSHRPGWLIEPPEPEALKWYFRNRTHWRNRFWTDVRHDPNKQASLNEMLGRARNLASRQGVDDDRVQSRSIGMSLDNVPLTDLTTVRVKLSHGKSILTERWRVDAANHFIVEISRVTGGTGTYRDWLEPFFNRTWLADQASWLAFWMEVEPQELPTRWLTSAARVLVPLVKVNSGTVFDVQLAGYLARADVFVTADKNFARIASRIAADAPFKAARSVRTNDKAWLATIADLRNDQAR